MVNVNTGLEQVVFQLIEYVEKRGWGRSSFEGSMRTAAGTSSLRSSARLTPASCSSRGPRPKTSPERSGPG